MSLRASKEGAPTLPEALLSCSLPLQSESSAFLPVYFILFLGLRDTALNIVPRGPFGVLLSLTHSPSLLGVCHKADRLSSIIQEPTWRTAHGRTLSVMQVTFGIPRERKRLQKADDNTSSVRLLVNVSHLTALPIRTDFGVHLALRAVGQGFRVIDPHPSTHMPI